VVLCGAFLTQNRTSTNHVPLYSPGESHFLKDGKARQAWMSAFVPYYSRLHVVLYCPGFNMLKGDMRNIHSTLL
jgi:hypothetical protein